MKDVPRLEFALFFDAKSDVPTSIMLDKTILIEPVNPNVKPFQTV